jgi:hypothetical protein
MGHYKSGLCRALIVYLKQICRLSVPNWVSLWRTDRRNAVAVFCIGDTYFLRVVAEIC